MPLLRTAAIAFCMASPIACAHADPLEGNDSALPFTIDEQRIREQIGRIVIEEGVPSISVAAVKGSGGIWAYASGFADKQTNRAATAATPYRLASVSKPITAVGIMLLADRGLIDLDEPANTYLGEQKIVARVGDAKDVTIRRLLAHRGGLPQHYNLIHANEAYVRRGLDETIALYGQAMLPPGTTHRYSNVGYAVLERIIEIQTGKSYEEFLSDELFAPLDMATAGVVTEPAHPDGAAIPYTRAGDRYPAYDMDTRGAGGVFMSASDLVKFGCFFNDALDGRSNLLSRAAAREMLEAQSPLPEGKREWYVLGWVHELRGEDRQYGTVYHLGSTPGVRAELWIYPDQDLVIATLVNEMSWTPLKRAREALVAAIVPELAFIGYPEIEISDPIRGRWIGEIDLSGDGRLPATIDFRDPSRPVLSIGNETVELRSVQTIEDGFVQIVTSAAKLPVTDVQRQAYELGFLLRPDGTRLEGYVSANRVATRIRDSGNFAFPVRLEKAASSKDE